MLRNRKDGRAVTRTVQTTMRSILTPNLLEIYWEKSVFFTQEVQGCEELCLARNLSWDTRLFRAALILAVLMAPGLIDGLPRPPFDSTLALWTHKAVGPLMSGGLPQLFSFFEPSPDSESSVTFEDIEAADNEERNETFGETQTQLLDAETSGIVPSDAALSPGPVQFRGMDEVVPYLIPMQPFAPRFFDFNSSRSMPTPDLDLGDALSPLREIPHQSVFYSPQSEELEVDDCQYFDAFLVSPLPSSLASRFKGFVQKEAAQADNMPYLHHIHGRPSVDSADSEDNPRLIVEGGKVTPLWSEDTDENPIIMMEEGTVTLIRLVAPVQTAYDAVASMMLMPITNVSISCGDGLLLSYRVSGVEGRQVNHQHVDGMHRPVAELDVAYKSCFSVGRDANEPIPVRAELRFGKCEPVVLMWRVICSSSALLQELPLGFHLSIGPSTPAANQGDPVGMCSVAGLPCDPSIVPFPTVADLQALISKEGDLVASGSPSERVSLVQTASLVFSPSQEFVELYAWCRGCETGKLDMQVPTVATDLEVMLPLLYNFVGSGQQQKSPIVEAPSLVASRPSSHIVLREAIAGSEENVNRFILVFQCKSEGESIVALDFAFHGRKDVQIFFKKQCAAPVSASIRDPSCSSGVLSEDGSGCCLISCGTCGGDGCEEQEGGLVGCCLTHIHSAALPCEAATAPCVMSTQNSRSTQELRMPLGLPEKSMVSRFGLLLAPLWLISMVLYLLKILFWCVATGAALVYVFTVSYGMQVLNEPFPVAAAPSATQLFNTLFLLAGHLRHLFQTHGGSFFDNGHFHSYAPFEERVHGSTRNPPRKENPFYPPTLCRSTDAGASFIRLTSFKGKSTLTHGQENDPPQRPRPMEFCDVEADGSSFHGRDFGNESVVWGEPQGAIQTDRWDDDDDETNVISSFGNEQLC